MMNSMLILLLILFLATVMFDLADCLHIVALGLSNDTVLLYDWTNRTVIGSFHGSMGTNPNTQLKFLTNGLLAAQVNSGNVNLINVLTQAVMQTYSVGNICMEQLSNGNLAMSWYGTKIYIFNLNTQKQVGKISTVDNQYSLKQTAVANYLASGGAYGSVNIWNLDSLKLVKTLVHSNAWTVTFLEVMGNGFLASVDYANTIKLWDIVSGLCLSTFLSSTTLAGIKLISSNVLAAAGGSKIQLLEMNATYQLNSFYSYTAPGTINYLRVSDEYQLVMSMGSIGAVGFFNLTSLNYTQIQLNIPGTNIRCLDISNSLNIPITPVPIGGWSFFFVGLVFINF
jgi:WD40 repeat protein